MTRASDEAGAGEHARDQDATDFTPALRRCLADVPGALAASFFDGDGESVDYCSSVDPYEAKIAGATLRVLLADLHRPVTGRVRAMTLVFSHRTYAVRSVADGYDIAVVAPTSEGTDARALEAATRAMHQLRIASGLTPPPGEPPELSVDVRTSAAWGYAPSLLVDDGRERSVASVLGRWLEGGSEREPVVVCFRVRTEDGEELTLTHDSASGLWERRR